MLWCTKMQNATYGEKMKTLLQSSWYQNTKNQCCKSSQNAVSKYTIKDNYTPSAHRERYQTIIQGMENQTKTLQNQILNLT